MSHLNKNKFKIYVSTQSTVGQLTYICYLPLDNGQEGEITCCFQGSEKLLNGVFTRDGTCKYSHCNIGMLQVLLHVHHTLFGGTKSGN